jgi:HEPN domain-containing protein
MRTLTREWAAKAEGDFRTATREARARRLPNYDAVCFHGQQCAEKYLKAYLQEQDQAFPRVHDLVELLELCLAYDGEFEVLRDTLKDLSKYAVDVRYPGESAVKADAQVALASAKQTRAFARRKLGLRR